MAGRRILVLGGGLAARCCLQLLQGQGYSASQGAETPSRRALSILVSQSTQTLLVDVFKSQDLFVGLPRIRQRVVAWASREAATLPHEAVVISESALLDRLSSRLGAARSTEPETHSGWTILTSQSADVPTLGAARNFGVRTARVHPVDLAPTAEPETCWVESTPQGWLFLLTMGPGAGSLLSVGGPATELLEKSRLIAGKIQHLDPVAAEIPAYPRILDEPCAPGWVACGSAAVAFDPLCGEGAGNATREAILACAAVIAILAGESTPDVLNEYAMRLRLGFLRHLENCREFYTQDSPTDFWREELQQIDRGLAWIRTQLTTAGPPKFRLTDFTLERTSTRP